MEIQEMFNILLGEIRENIVRVTEIPGKYTQNLRDELNAAKQIIGINSVDIQMLKSKIG